MHYGTCARRGAFDQRDLSAPAEHPQPRPACSARLQPGTRAAGPPSAAGAVSLSNISLREGLDGTSDRTRTLYEGLLGPVLDAIGARPLRVLSAGDVRSALSQLATRYSTRSLQITRNSLERAIRHAESNDLVGRNVAALVKAPQGRSGRPSKRFTLEQAKALLAGSEHTRLHAYVVLSLLVGIRTEEARALRWDHVVTWADDPAGWQLASRLRSPRRRTSTRYALRPREPHRRGPLRRTIHWRGSQEGRFHPRRETRRRQLGRCRPHRRLVARVSEGSNRLGRKHLRGEQQTGLLAADAGWVTRPGRRDGAHARRVNAAGRCSRTQVR